MLITIFANVYKTNNIMRRKKLGITEADYLKACG